MLEGENEAESKVNDRLLLCACGSACAMPISRELIVCSAPSSCVCVHSSFSPKPLSRVSRWRALEAAYASRGYAGAGPPWSAVLRTGSLPLLWSAPHAVRHMRHGRGKRAERGTGGLAELLALETGAIAVCAAGHVGNWEIWKEREDAFAASLRSFSQGRLVIDLHGMTDHHQADLCIGLGPSPSLLSRSFAALLLYRFSAAKVLVNAPFDATPAYTVTSFVQQHLHGDALQLEIRAGWRELDELCTWVRGLVDVAENWQGEHY